VQKKSDELNRKKRQKLMGAKGGKKKREKLNVLLANLTSRLTTKYEKDVWPSRW
jgi:hypothetical protein